MVRVYVGALIGAVVVYLVGALVAWNWNPGEWHWFWRLWCAPWLVIWVIGGAMLGDNLNIEAIQRRHMRRKAQRS